MSEWTDEKQSTALLVCKTEMMACESGYRFELFDRMYKCLQLCAGHADLAKCEVVDKDELGHLRSLTHAMESQVANRLRADLCTEQRRYEDMHQVAYRVVQALKKLSFAAQTTGGVAGPDAGLQEAIQEAGHVMSMAGVSEAVDAASELIALRAELATLRADLAHANGVIASQAGEIATLREQLSVAQVHKTSAPARCPFTGRPHFMDIEHPELGLIATYGGPYDSYTIPQRDDDNPEYYVYRFDHDEGYWIDGVESIGLMVVDDQKEVIDYDELEELREQLAAREADAARYQWLRSAECKWYIDDLSGITEPWQPEQLDAAIDKARQEGGANG